MKPRERVFIDNWGTMYAARSVADLAEQLGYARGSARRIYRDKRDGSVVHVGYVIGRHWLTEYAPVERPVK